MKAVALTPAEILHAPRIAGPVGERRSGGWVLVTESWSTAEGDAIRERYLSTVERTRYDGMNDRKARTWLLGRLAVKDAVCLWHADRNRVVAPHEVVVDNDEGRPYVLVVATGVGEPDLHVSIAHLPGATVAMVAEGHSVGIDIEEVAERPSSFLRVAFAAVEREARAIARTGHHAGPHAQVSDPLWMAAAWSAKEAVGKAFGTGLQGRPTAYPTELVDDDVFEVRGRLVRWTVLDPGVACGPNGRALVVAWTLAPMTGDLPHAERSHADRRRRVLHRPGGDRRSATDRRARVESGGAATDAQMVAAGSRRSEPLPAAPTPR